MTPLRRRRDNYCLTKLVRLPVLLSPPECEYILDMAYDIMQNQRFQRSSQARSSRGRGQSLGHSRPPRGRGQSWGYSHPPRGRGQSRGRSRSPRDREQSQGRSRSPRRREQSQGRSRSPRRKEQSRGQSPGGQWLQDRLHSFTEKQGIHDNSGVNDQTNPRTTPQDLVNFHQATPLDQSNDSKIIATQLIFPPDESSCAPVSVTGLQSMKDIVFCDIPEISHNNEMISTLRSIIAACDAISSGPYAIYFPWSQCNSLSTPTFTSLIASVSAPTMSDTGSACRMQAIVIPCSVSFDLRMTREEEVKSSKSKEQALTQISVISVVDGDYTCSIDDLQRSLHSSKGTRIITILPVPRLDDDGGVFFSEVHSHTRLDSTTVSDTVRLFVSDSELTEIAHNKVQINRLNTRIPLIRESDSIYQTLLPTVAKKTAVFLSPPQKSTEVDEINNLKSPFSFSALFPYNAEYMNAKEYCHLINTVISSLQRKTVTVPLPSVDIIYDLDVASYRTPANFSILFVIVMSTTNTAVKMVKLTSRQNQEVSVELYLLDRDNVVGVIAFPDLVDISHFDFVSLIASVRSTRCHRMALQHAIFLISQFVFDSVQLDFGYKFSRSITEQSGYFRAHATRDFLTRRHVFQHAIGSSYLEKAWINAFCTMTWDIQYLLTIGMQSLSKRFSTSPHEVQRTALLAVELMRESHHFASCDNSVLRQVLCTYESGKKISNMLLDAVIDEVGNKDLSTIFNPTHTVFTDITIDTDLSRQPLIRDTLIPFMSDTLPISIVIGIEYHNDNMNLRLDEFVSSETLITLPIHETRHRDVAYELVYIMAHATDGDSTRLIPMCKTPERSFAQFTDANEFDKIRVDDFKVSGNLHNKIIPSCLIYRKVAADSFIFPFSNEYVYS